ncbi:MAG: SBBP repeat-containing protein, partial [Limisphaerales bacterium]
MNLKSASTHWLTLLFTATVYVVLLTISAHAQFLWSERIASANDWPDGEPNTGLALDTNDTCYVAGYFDGTNDFGGVTLTNQSIGGSDIYVAKYNSTGALQWVQRAGGSSNNYGHGIGVDTNGNIYVTGGYSGLAKFGGITLPAPSGEEFFLAKYNNAGVVQWVQSSTGGSDDVDGIGLTVDGAGNSYALVVVDDFEGAGGSVTFGSTTVIIPANSGTTMTLLVKYDNTGAAKWAQLFASSQES